MVDKGKCQLWKEQKKARKKRPRSVERGDGMGKEEEKQSEWGP